MSTIQRLTHITVAWLAALLILRALDNADDTPVPVIHAADFKCKTATADEIRARCVALGKSDEYARFMVLCYRSGMTRKEIAAEMCIAEGTVKKYKHDRTLEMEKPRL